MPKKIVDIKIKQTEEPSSSGTAESKEAVEEEFLKTITHNSTESSDSSTTAKKPRRRSVSTATRSARPAAARKKTTSSRRSFSFMKFLILLAGAGIFATAVYALGLNISNVNIGLETEKDSLSKSFDFIFRESPTASFESGRMLLPLYQYKKAFTYSQKYSSTGEGEGESYASGELKIYNENSENSQILIAGTRFESQDKKVFRLVSRVVVPGYKNESGRIVPGVVLAEVRADQAGPDFNLGPARFTIPAFLGSSRFEKIYGLSEKSFSGGAAGKIPMIVKADLDDAREKIIEHAYNTAKEEVLAQAPDNLKLLEKAIVFTPGQISLPQPGGKVSEFKATISGELAVFVFDENEVKTRISERLAEESKIKADLQSVSYEIFYENPEFDSEIGALSLSIKVRRNLSAIVDTLEFKQKIAGQTMDEMRAELLKLEGVEKIKVSLWPFWAKRVPDNLDRIKIVAE